MKSEDIRWKEQIREATLCFIADHPSRILRRTDHHSDPKGRRHRP